MSLDALRIIPPPGWPKAVIWQAPDGPKIYRISKSRRRWQGEMNYCGSHKGIYYRPFDGSHRCHYIRLTRKEAEDTMAPEALPRWLRVSEGL